MSIDLLTESLVSHHWNPACLPTPARTRPRPLSMYDSALPFILRRPETCRRLRCCLRREASEIWSYDSFASAAQ